MSEAWRLLEARKLLKRACEEEGDTQRRMVLLATQHCVKFVGGSCAEPSPFDEIDAEGEASRMG